MTGFFHLAKGIFSRFIYIVAYVSSLFIVEIPLCWASLVASMVKNLPAMQETGVQSLGWEEGYPLQCSCLENPMDRAAWWATVHVVAKSRRVAKTRTWLTDSRFHLSHF